MPKLSCHHVNPLLESSPSTLPVIQTFKILKKHNNNNTSGFTIAGLDNSTESFAGEEDVYGSVEEKMGSPAYLSTDVCLGQFQGHLGISNCFFQFFLPRVPQRSRTGATVAQPQGFEPDCTGRASSTLIRFCDLDVQIYSKGIYREELSWWSYHSYRCY